MTAAKDVQQPDSLQECMELRTKFVELAQWATEECIDSTAAAAALMVDLLTAGGLLCEDDRTKDRADEIIAFCRDEAYSVLMETKSEDALADIRDAIERWDNCISLLAPEERFACQSIGDWSEDTPALWEESDANDEVDSAGCSSHVSVDVAEILASLSVANPEAEPPAAPDEERLPVISRAPALPQPPTAVETIDDAEMIAAFAADAQQCLAEMEASVLQMETASNSEECLQKFCRQLHTLKGASGTVGLSQLATYLHNLESYVEAVAAEADVDRLLEGVDAVQAQLKALGVGQGDVAGAACTPVNCPSGNNADSARSRTRLPVAEEATGEVFVRVESSRLERLMDLLAELVMLRNRRDSYVDSLRIVHHELNQCSARTRGLTSITDFAASDLADKTTENFAQENAGSQLLDRSLIELSKDTAELGRSLQEVFDPLSDDNSAVSHLIGRFRQELMQLRRQSVGGLFQRLQRSIRDAAKAEGKQVEVQFDGQGARADRSIQETLFEPLLHLVRNAVSHGIQDASLRIAKGKPAAGLITLGARSDAASLWIEVRDDGQGIDTDAVESRARDVGLLLPGESVTQEQLWKLIFHPGFSTRTAVSQVSGRGVGMDVVDSWLRRLRGRIEIESVAGQGTTFRLQIPLRSAVEHAMVVRAGGQLFALPMHAISGTSDAGVPLAGLAGAPSENEAPGLGTIIGCADTSLTQSCRVVLKDSAGGQNVTIAVDSIVGVEEVVVRSLPSLLQGNELLAGVTLSGSAETVLVLDITRIIEISRQQPSAQRSDTRPQNTTSRDRPCVLVVDDSVVVRRVLSKKLVAVGCDVRTARGGRDALDVLRSGGIAAVVTDLDMPGMNGVELVQEITSQEHLRQVPVAILSSRDEESMPADFRSCGPVAVLRKPVTDQTISDIVDAFSDVFQYRSHE